MLVQLFTLSTFKGTTSEHDFLRLPHQSSMAYLILPVAKDPLAVQMMHTLVQYTGVPSHLNRKTA
jgi:hypothetical protein